MFFINKVNVIIIIAISIDKWVDWEEKTKNTVYTTSEKVSHSEEIFFCVILPIRYCVRKSTLSANSKEIRPWLGILFYNVQTWHVHGKTWKVLQKIQLLS